MGPIMLILMLSIIVFRVFVSAKHFGGSGRDRYSRYHSYTPYNRVSHSTSVTRTRPQRRPKDLAEEILFDYDTVLQNNRTAIRRYSNYTGFDDSRQNLLRVLRLLINRAEEVGAAELFSVAKYKCGLLILAMYEGDYRNKVSDWTPDANLPVGDPHFFDLVKFLLIQYEVPAFLENAWFDLWQAQGRYFYLQIGNGAPVKNLKGLPVPLSRMEAHWLLKAPAHYNICQAVRWAQLKAMNAPDEMVRHVMTSYLGWSFTDDADFEKEVLRWFAQHEPYYYVLTGELVAYALAMREKDPTWSIKGRTIEALMDQSRVYHDFNREEEIAGYHKWKPSGIGKSTWAAWDKLGLDGYQLVELLDTEELRREGDVMNHCVATYAYTCLSYRSTIFSLRKDEESSDESVATIEVDLINKRIAQAMGIDDVPIGDKVEKWLRQWAETEGLKCEVLPEAQ